MNKCVLTLLIPTINFERKKEMKSRKLISALVCAVLLFASIFAISGYAASSTTSDGLNFPKQDDSVYDLVSSVALDYPAENYKAEKKLESVPETVEAWVFYPSTLAGKAAGPVIGNYYSDGKYGESFINFEISANGAPRIWCSDEFAYNLYDIVFDKARVPVDTWTHVTYVYDNESGVASCYINGQLKEEKFFYPELPDSTTHFPFVLGGDQRTANGGYFKGELKDVAMFSDARTAEEVASDYVNVPYNTEDLLCYYDVDASDKGKNIKDETGNGYDLIYSKTWLSEAEMEEVRKGYGDFKADYSFAVFGDTQRITEDYPNLLAPMYQWVVDNKDSKNIVYSIGLGDITDDNGYDKKYSKDANGNWVLDANGTYTEWDIAEDAISVLNGHVPYSLVRGNHDIMKSYDYFNDHFKDIEFFTSQFEGENGGKYTDTGAKDPVTKASVSYANTWCTFTVTVDGVDVNYLFLNLDYGASDEVLDWAGSVISQDKYKNHKVIVSTHCYLYADGTTDDTGDGTPPSIMRDFMNNGDDMWDEFVVKHPNIEMVLSGHVSSDHILVTRSNAYIDGIVNTVTEMLINPQAVDYRVRSGLVAMFYFDASENKVAFEYYSPTRNAYYMTANQFVIDLDDEGVDKPDDKWDGTTLTAPEGSGTKSDPYLVSNPSNLLWMAKKIIDSESNAVFAGKYFKQTCDIDLDGKMIQSIGFYFESFSNMRAFDGNYDGCGYSIKNGVITSAASQTYIPAFTTSFGSGLFGAIYGAVIENVVLENVQVVGRGVSGAIVGIAGSPAVSYNDEFVSFNIISGCVVKDTVEIVTVNTESGNASNTGFDNSFKAGRVGSICGMANGTLIEGCTSAANIVVGADFVFAGGIAGTAGLNTVIDNCAFTGAITQGDAASALAYNYGGIVGAVSPSEKTTDTLGNAVKAVGDLTLTNCYTTGTYTFGGTKPSNVDWSDIAAYTTVGNLGTYTATNCLISKNDAIDASIEAIKKDGAERVWYVGSGAPTVASNAGDKYLDTATGVYYSYTDGVWKQLSNLEMTVVSLETPYGTIPEEHRGSSMVAFTRDNASSAWTFHAGYSDYYTMTANARTPVSGSNTAQVVVYFRSDVTAESYSTNFNWNVGTIIFDLNGFTIYQSAKNVLPAVAKYGNAYDKNPSLYGSPAYYEITNGNVVLNNKGLLDMNAYGDVYAANATESNYKTLNYTFKNVNISLAEGATVTELIGTITDSSSVSKNFAQKMQVNVKFEDSCTIDISNATKKINIFGANDKDYKGKVSGKSYYCTNTIVNIEVGAISVITDSNNFTWYSVNANNGSSVKFLENASGRYATLTVPSSLTPTTNVDLPGTKTFAHDLYKFSTNSTANTVTYTLTETPYGGIGSACTDIDAYPLVVFKDNGDGTYEFLKGCSQFGGQSKDGGAVDYAKSINDTSVRNIVYLRKDMTTTLPSTNVNWSVSTIVIDLGGHTVTPETYFLPASAKYQSGRSWKDNPVYGEPGYYEIINGEIALKDYGLLQINAFSETYNSDADDEHYKAMYFAFDNVKFTLAKGAALKSITGKYEEKSAITNGNKKMLIDIKYNNCVFDVREAVNTINFFNANDSLYTGLVDGQNYYYTNTIVNITVKGAELISGKASINLWTANSKNGSWVKFIPDENGNYVTLSRSKDASYPDFRANNKTLEFVKTGEGTDTYIYSLAPAEFKAYSPKMSITLANSFVMNIYVPANSTEEFTFNGNTYNSDNNFGGDLVDLDGDLYYHVTIALGSSEAAKEVKLSAKVNMAEKTATATFTFSIPKYAAKLLADEDATDVEKTLVRDVLAYIKASYNYVGFAADNTAEEIARVNTLIEGIIGDYVGTPTTSGANADNNGGAVSGVTLNLDATPSIRFYTADAALKFYANGRKLNTVSGSDSNGAYVELDVYAYLLAETITFGNGGSYHISSFVEGAGENEKALASAFVKYVESASDYRKSVIAAD